MWAEIIYWIGVLCAIWCVYDLFTTKHVIGMPLKLLIAVGILFFSWIGTLVYWFLLRDKLK